MKHLLSIEKLARADLDKILTDAVVMKLRRLPSLTTALVKGLTVGGPFTWFTTTTKLARCRTWGAIALRFARAVTYEVRCNWKVYVDNFLEGYHVPYVHPELYTLYDYEHYVTEIHDRYSVQIGPLTAQRNVYTAGGGEGLYYFVFPNLMLNVVPGRLQLNVVIPTAVDRCQVLFRYYYDDLDAPGAGERIEADLRFSDHVQREDAEICARVQQGLGSRAYDRGRFSVRFEEGVHHFQQLLKQTYRDYLASR